MPPTACPGAFWPIPQRRRSRARLEAVKVQRHGNRAAATTADGGTVVAGAPGSGAAVAVTILDASTLAWLAGVLDLTAGTITETSLTPFPRCRGTCYPVVWLGRPALRRS